ncbi:RNA pseudouridine synthase [Stenotrophomonas phage DLP4]|nr:RNA pseudouridine synthase [Stenotrophomonas phage DLP4]
MAEITDIRRVRQNREQAQLYHRDPDLFLEAWLNDKGEIVATQVKGTFRAPSETGPQAHDLADNLLGMASQGASILGDEHWQAQPVFTAHLLRGGFMMTRARRFWHEEGKQPLAKRLRCAWWVARSAWGALAGVLAACYCLVLHPGKAFPAEEED